MTRLMEMYEWLFTELADPRVKNLALMSGPIPVSFLLVLYGYMIKVWLPNYMKNKPPYDLKTVINAYNIFQVIINAILFKGLLTSGWLTTVHLGCALVDYSDNPEAVNMAWWMWLTLMTRVFDLVETSFFILRKKDNQASLLHIYHHVATVSVMWIAVKYAPGGMASLTPLINTLVHSIMYSYYYLTSIAGPNLRRILNKFKIWITVIQMTQFTILLLHILQALLPSCPVPMILFWIYLPNLLLVYYLFYDFFRKSYLTKASKTT